MRVSSGKPQNGTESGVPRRRALGVPPQPTAGRPARRRVRVPSLSARPAACPHQPVPALVRRKITFTMLGRVFFFKLRMLLRSTVYHACVQIQRLMNIYTCF